MLTHHHQPTSTLVLVLLLLTLTTLPPLALTHPPPSPSPNKPPTITIHPRKEVSHNIFCPVNDLPPPNRWPSNAPSPHSNYATLEQLCRFDRSRPNVGCLCDAPYVQVECRRELADPLLYAAFLPECAHFCYCAYTPRNPFDTSVAAVEAWGRWVWMGTAHGTGAGAGAGGRAS